MSQALAWACRQARYCMVHTGMCRELPQLLQARSWSGATAAMLCDPQDAPGRTCLTMPRASMHTTPMPALPAPSTAKRCSVIASGVLPAPADPLSGASAGYTALADHVLIV